VHRDLRFVDEHLRELIALFEVAMETLDSEHLFESAQSASLRAEDLGHAPDSDFLEEPVLAKLLGAIYHSWVNPVLQTEGSKTRASGPVRVPVEGNKLGGVFTIEPFGSRPYDSTCTIR
jgi:hypothetical protein